MAYAINRSPPKAEATGSNPVGCANSLPLCANSLAHLGYASENSSRSGWHNLGAVQGELFYGDLNPWMSPKSNSIARFSSRKSTQSTGSPKRSFTRVG